MDYKLIASGDSDNPAIFSPTGIPTVGDSLWTNGFNLNFVGDFSCDLISNRANAGIGAVVGTTTTGICTATTACVLNFLVDNGVIVAATQGLIRLTTPPTGQIVWTGGVQSVGVQPFLILGSFNTTIVLNLLNSGTGVTNQLFRSSMTNGTLVLNISAALNLTTNLFDNTNTTPDKTVVVNGDYSNAAGITNAVGTTKFIRNGALGFGVPKFAGITAPNYILCDSVDLTGFGTFEVTGAIKLKDKNSFHILTNFEDGTTEALSIVPDSPNEDNVIKDVVYDFGNKIGKSHKPPLDMVAKGVQSGLGVGTAQMLRVSDVLDALRDSNHESAEHFRNTSTNQSVQAQLQAALNS